MDCKHFCIFLSAGGKNMTERNEIRSCQSIHTCKRPLGHKTRSSCKSVTPSQDLTSLKTSVPEGVR